MEVCHHGLQVFVACAGKVTPFIIIYGSSLEEGLVFIAGPNGE